jgi:hypothetical protein
MSMGEGFDLNIVIAASSAILFDIQPLSSYLLVWSMDISLCTMDGVCVRCVGVGGRGI